ncbi:MAG: hypothetical protein KDJ77_12980, partial [Rhodobiaceae bacterium]|nr:hypothetical protein [Rhodobiaceae bacterium]
MRGLAVWLLALLVSGAALATEARFGAGENYKTFSSGDRQGGYSGHRSRDTGSVSRNSAGGYASRRESTGSAGGKGSWGGSSQGSASKGRTSGGYASAGRQSGGGWSGSASKGRTSGGYA